MNLQKTLRETAEELLDWFDSQGFPRGKYDDIKKEQWASCPFCKDGKLDNFSVSLDSAKWHCFKCDISGVGLDGPNGLLKALGLERQEAFSFSAPTARQRVAERKKAQSPEPKAPSPVMSQDEFEDVFRGAYHTGERYPWDVSDDEKQVDAYFQKRGIPFPPMEAVICWVKAGTQLSFMKHQLEKPAILFPTIVEGEVVHVHYKLVGGGYYNSPGPKPIWVTRKYSPVADDTIVVVEGIFDALSVYQAGYLGAALLGGTITANHDLSIFRDKNVVVMLDGDEAGQAKVQEIVNTLLPIAKSVQIATIPLETTDSGDKVKDPNDVLVHYGKGRLKELIEDATSSSTPETKDISEEEEATAQSKPKFNRVKEKIEWAKWSWNPVVGCLGPNGQGPCEYCYARDIAVRFYGHFEPTFYPERLEAPKNTPLPAAGENGGNNVFVCSMADLFGEVKQEWIDAVLQAVREAPQWNFLFLTKNPKRLVGIDWPTNAWVGTTVDVQARVAPAEEAFRQIKASVKFLSCEPLLEPLTFSSLEMFDWVIIGGRSKNSRLPEFLPRREWVEALTEYARKAKCKVYWKDNLKIDWTPEGGIPKEYPSDSETEVANAIPLQESEHPALVESNQSQIVDTTELSRIATPSPLIAIPEICWRGIFKSFREAHAGTTEAPDEFFFGGLMSAAGAILGRCCYLYMGNPLYPNFYVCFVGESADPRKSTAARKGTEVIQSADPLVILAFGLSTAEGLMLMFQESESEEPTRLNWEGQRVLVWIDEFSGLLKKAKQDYSAPLIEMLQRFYDNPDKIEIRTKVAPMSARKPSLSLLTATTREKLARHLSSEDIEGGFANRFSFFTGQRKPPIPRPNKPDEIHLANKVVMVLHQARLRWKHTEFSFAPDTIPVWDDFYIREYYDQGRDEITSGLTKRIRFQVLKLALIYAATENTEPIITKEQLEASVAWALEYEKPAVLSLFEEYGMSEQVKLEHQITQFCNGSDKTKRDIQRRFTKMPSKRLNDTIDSMVKSGILISETRICQGGNGKKYRTTFYSAAPC